MSNLRINLSSLRRKQKEFRDQFERHVENGLNTWSEYGEYLRSELRPSRHLWQPESARTYDDLRIELNVAAGALQGRGASAAQIEQILHLAGELNDYRPVISSGTMSRQEASRIIKIMKKDAGL